MAARAAAPVAGRRPARRPRGTRTGRTAGAAPRDAGHHHRLRTGQTGQRLLPVPRRRQPSQVLAESPPLCQRDIDDGTKPGTSSQESAELRQARCRIKLLEQESEVLRRAAAYRRSMGAVGSSVDNIAAESWIEAVKRETLKGEKAKARLPPHEARGVPLGEPIQHRPRQRTRKASAGPETGRGFVAGISGRRGESAVVPCPPLLRHRARDRAGWLASGESREAQAPGLRGCFCAGPPGTPVRYAPSHPCLASGAAWCAGARLPDQPTASEKGPASTE